MAQEANYLKILDEARNELTKSSFIYNDKNESREVLKDILYHLSICDEFYFSVAFITDGGLNKLKMALKEAQERGVKGKIISTNYLSFSEPKALEFLLKFENIESRMFYLTKEDNIGFHTKGYIFKEGNKYVAIIGSSNLTSSALTINKEWNNLIEGSKDIVAIKNILYEFNKMFNLSTPLKEVLDNYKTSYEAAIRIKKEFENQKQKDAKIQLIRPNSMQNQVIFNTNALINKGEKRGLLISATGTGKTFASAFLTKNISSFKVKKLLFIVHRETILKQAKDTFDFVYEGKINSSIYSGNSKDIEGKDFIFASYSLMIRKDILNQFKKDEFDLIVIDEVHRVGNNHYQDIINYFTPKFLLGMSATPDRSDGYDIYSLFDHNIIYEIRLMDALNFNLLTTFNYFGIKDITVNGKLLDDESDFNLLTNEERVKHILEEAEYYNFSGKRAKGLVFVSSIEEGKELSKKMNLLGKKTLFLDGSNKESEREEAIKRLESDEEKTTNLDYILTVNIFNEGVDIPSINQIILLRPTKSAIIFTQQIGRGLRKFPGKEYLVILDFIGNYKGNFYIAKALNKGKITKSEIVKTVNDILPGEATISFDKVAKEKIFDSIEKARINTKEEVFNDFIDLKNRLNHIPSLIEIDEYSSLSARVFLDYQIFNSYYEFLVAKKLIKDSLNEEEKVTLKYLAKAIFDGKRHLELDILKDLFYKGEALINNYVINLEYMPKIIDEFLTINEKSFPIKLGEVKLKENKVYIGEAFKKMLENETFKKEFLDGLNYAYYANKKYFDFKNDFKLFEKYTRFDVTRLTNIGRNNVATINGYGIKEKEGVIPVFIDYKKGKDAIQYEDYFIDENTLNWSSRNRRTLNSKEIKRIIELTNSKKAKLLIFIQKSNLKMIQKEGFYYLGEASIIDAKDFKDMNGENRVHFTLRLNNPVRQDIYDFITSFTDERIS